MKKLEPKHHVFLGVVCVILGIAALITPFTPGSWLIFIGFQFLGVTFFAKAKKADKEKPPAA